MILAPTQLALLLCGCGGPRGYLTEIRGSSAPTVALPIAFHRRTVADMLRRSPSQRSGQTWASSDTSAGNVGPREGFADVEFRCGAPLGATLFGEAVFSPGIWGGSNPLSPIPR